MQIARRIEEVRAEPVAPERLRSSVRDRGDWNAGRVRADDRVRAAMRLDAREQLALDLDPLDDRLEDPVGGRNLRQVVVEAAGRDEGGAVGREEGIGLQPPRALEALLRGRGGDVEQHDGNAGIGEVGGDLRPHRAGAQDGG